MNDTEQLLEACGLGRCARPENKWLLRDVTLAVAPGQRLAIVGPSGSGKTLLLRALALLDPLDAGEIRWRGELIAGHHIPAYRRHVMYLHQRPALLEGTVEDNLREPYRLAAHRNLRFDSGHIAGLLRRLGREPGFLDKQARDLSGGEQQITALLRAVQFDPEILLLDEPTAALDSSATQAIEQLIDAWLDERGGTSGIVWVSHDLQQAQRVSQEVLLMDDGQLRGE